MYSQAYFRKLLQIRFFVERPEKLGAPICSFIFVCRRYRLAVLMVCYQTIAAVVPMISVLVRFVIFTGLG